MTSSLRAKLNMMRSGCAQPGPTARPGLTVRFARADLLNQLEPGAAALRRMGFGAAWPGEAKVVYLDTETTGLSGGAGTVAFLVGLGYLDQGQFVTEQLMLGDYADEAGMMTRVIERLQGFDAVVTFNGNAFDLPLLESRLTMLRMQGRMPPLHRLDLLPPARRLWKRRLGSVRLSVLEESVLRSGRKDDLPGSEAPRRFFEALKTGDYTRLEPVIEHNRLDILALPILLRHLTAAYENPAGQAEVADLISMGRAMEKFGERAEAISCYGEAGRPRTVVTAADLRAGRIGSEALCAMGLLYRRMGDPERAARAWEEAAARGQMGALPMVELAKYHEHVTRDLDAALGWTTCALALGGDQEALEKRKRRLENRISRAGGRRLWD